ncbi:MAG: DinB family protein [Candidatus Dormibacteraeota bacterium]|nr:DinB family protein [Candidatus Dormibacteraeota bacterium]
MTLAELRLNSNHGRLMHAARNLPAVLRESLVPGGGWTAHQVLAHVLAWQEEAARRLVCGQAPELTRCQVDEWNARALASMQDLSWEEILWRLQTGHDRLKGRLREEPPSWFGDRTYRHYMEHTRELLALAASATWPTPLVVGGRPGLLLSRGR